MSHAWLSVHMNAQECFAPAFMTVVRRVPVPAREVLDAANALAVELQNALLRLTPLALRAVRQRSGPEAERLAMECLAQQGFPEDHPLPPRGREDKRLTPGEVRVYWKAADEALHATFNGTLPEGVRKESTITLSWAVHIIGMERFDWYRDMIREEYHLHQLSPRTGPPI